MENYSLKSIPDHKLIVGLKALVRREAETTVEILLHLNEVSKRRLFAAEGYSSLWDYCTKGPLKYSESAAHRRITAAGLISRFPDLIPLLRSKELSLTSLAAVAPIIRKENKNEVPIQFQI